MLMSILGGLGCGKTLLMVILANYQRQPIVSNFHLQLPNHVITPFDMTTFIRAEYHDCVILLDEAYTYLESRVSGGAELNRIMSYILFQSRKKSVELYITAQLYSSIDKRFRELSDSVVIAEPRNPKSDEDFTYRLISGNIVFSNLTFRYHIVKSFFTMYNTNEVITTTNKKILFDMMSSDEKLAEIKRLSNEVKSHYSKRKHVTVTEDMVNLYCDTHDIPKFIRRDIFSTLKLREKEQKMRKTGEKIEHE